MQIHHASRNMFQQLADVLQQLTTEQYVQPSLQLSNATIGQHVRHLIELFLCLEKGYKTGVVNYDKRKRDHRIETDKLFAGALLEEIWQNQTKPDKLLLLEISFREPDERFVLNTNYYRELVYNVEHTVHHMALIRVGVNEVSEIFLPAEFGVASSTLTYRESCVR